MPNYRYQFDVVVVGGGGSGLAAAVSAAENGLRVVLLEKMSQLGGTTGIAIGALTANQTKQQSDQSISDNPLDHNQDAGLFASPDIEARGNRELREFFLAQSGDTLAWLESFGLTFHGPSAEPPNRVPRMHNVVPNAKAYIAALHKRLVDLGGRIEFNATVTTLLKKDDRVTGVKVLQNGQEQEYFASHGVVLAAGDYTSNSRLISKYKGAEFASIEGINPNSQGEGQLLASSVGAKLLNMDVTYGPEFRFMAPTKKPFSQLLPSSGLAAKMMGRLMPLVPKSIISAMIKRLLVTWQHPENSLFDDGAVLINQHGSRFCDETKSPEREIAVASQPNKIAYLLLDSELINRYSKWPHFISTAPEIAYAYVKDYLRLRPDVAIAGDSWDEIAIKRSLPYKLKLNDPSLPPAKREGLANAISGPCVLLGPIKSYFTTTEGGAAIDTNFRVLDEAEKVIPGLYAIGQTGLGGQILWGHGLHIAWAMTSGRLVGIELARS